MDMNITAAREMLEKPSEEMETILKGSSSEAKAAIQSIAPAESSLQQSLSVPNGSNGAASNGADEGSRSRLQVVDEVGRDSPVPNSCLQAETDITLNP